MKKLAWALLLFVLPAMPTMWSVVDLGMFFGTLARLAATSIIAVASYWALESIQTRQRRPT
jgi:hypothetical protein